MLVACVSYGATLTVARKSATRYVASMTDPKTTRAHVNLPAEILSEADVPSGWFVLGCFGEPGAYVRAAGDIMPTKAALNAGETLRRALDLDVHVIPKHGSHRGAICIVGRDGRLYEIQPKPAAVSVEVYEAWLIATWYSSSPASARREAVCEVAVAVAFPALRQDATTEQRIARLERMSAAKKAARSAYKASTDVGAIVRAFVNG